MHAHEFRPLRSIDRRGRYKDDDDGRCLFDMDTGKRRGGIRRDRWLHCRVPTADGDARYICSNSLLEVRCGAACAVMRGTFVCSPPRACLIPSHPVPAPLT